MTAQNVAGIKLKRKHIRYYLYSQLYGGLFTATVIRTFSRTDQRQERDEWKDGHGEKT